MATFASKFATGQLATTTSPCAGVVIAQDYFIDATAAQLVAGTIFDLGELPPGHTVGDMVLVTDDIDTNATPLVTLDVGIMSGTVGDTTSVRTCGAEFYSADTTARAGGVARMSLATGFKLQATALPRSIGVKVLAAPATAAAGRIRLRVWMHPSDTYVPF